MAIQDRDAARRSRRRILVLCVTATLPILLSGCGLVSALGAGDNPSGASAGGASAGGGSGTSGAQNAGPDANGLYTGAGVQAEYTAAVESWSVPLPSGQKFPANIPPTASGVRSQAGVGESYAAFYWVCSWEDVYLKANAASDSTDENLALKYLKEWPTLSWSKKYLQDPTHVWQNTAVTPAALGDPSGVAAFYQSDCTYYREVNR